MKVSRSQLLIIAMMVVLPAQAVAAHFDTLILNGTVIDGSGSEGHMADLGVRDGKIIEIGQLKDDSANNRIDATGLVVAPGFIDLHSHAERGVMLLPHLDNLVQQGITTILGGNCGFSPVAFDEFYRQAKTLPLGPNLGLLVGHNDVRERVMGREQRLANETEVTQMQGLVEKAMKAGAYGLSTGLKYVPGVYSDYPEVRALAKTAAEYDGIFTSHMRDEGAQIKPAIEEVLAVARDTGIPVHISHHKIIGAPNWGESEQTLAMIQQAREAGIDVTLDQYPYTASSTRFAILFPPWAQAGGQEKIEQRLKDPATRAKIKAGIEQNIREDRGGGDASRLQIAHFAKKPEWDGLTFAQILEEQGREVTLPNAAELAMEIQAQGGAQGIFHAIDEQDVKAIMAYPFTSIATDASGVKMGEGSPHPRSYGTFPRVLGRYVREDGVLSLPDAIYKMTALPAARLGLKNRGILHEGYQADIVVFNPKTVIDNATFTSPHQYSDGIEYILINGVEVKNPQGMTGKTGGQLLRHNDPKPVG